MMASKSGPVLAMMSALLLISLAPVVSANNLPDITAIPIPSQGVEAVVDGVFTMEILTTTGGVRGIFTANVAYTFSCTSGPVPCGTVSMGGLVTGTYMQQGDELMLQFAGTGFRGQLTGEVGSLWGFVTTPGNGYLTQVFIWEPFI